jgi:glycosyltransferase involved in cell wall biosynthesis
VTRARACVWSEAKLTDAAPSNPSPTARPLVSIVLPTYNGARYLAQSIESCLAQTLGDWELILVDDCSTDETPRIIERYVARDPARVRSIRNDPNRRLPGSLNVGFAAARGQLLTWTSDDNLYRPNALAEMAAFLREHPEVDFVYADSTVIDENGQPVAYWKANPPEELAHRNVVNACFLYRRAVQERLGGYAEEWALVEDWEFWLRASMQFRLAALNRDLYHYRQHAGSLTTQKRQQIHAAVVRMLDQHLPRMRVSRSVRGRSYLMIAALCRLHGRRAACLKHLSRALLYAPRYTVARAWREVTGRRGGRAPSVGSNGDTGPDRYG